MGHLILPVCESEEWKSLSHVQLFVTPWTAACQAPLSKGFSRQESWSGLPFPSLGNLSTPGITLVSPALQVDSLLSETPGEPNKCYHFKKKKNPKGVFLGLFNLLPQQRYVIKAALICCCIEKLPCYNLIGVPLIPVLSLFPLNACSYHYILGDISCV